MRAAAPGKETRAVPPAQTLSDQASIGCDSPKRTRWYLLLALAAQELLPLPALALVCAVLLQVLEFGGGRRVVSSLAGAVCSLPEDEAEEGITSGTSALSFCSAALVHRKPETRRVHAEKPTPASEIVPLSPVGLTDREASS